MFKREYHFLVHVYKKGSSGKIYSQHSFTMWNRRFLPMSADDLHGCAIDNAIKKSDYGNLYDAVVVQSMSRIR